MHGQTHIKFRHVLVQSHHHQEAHYYYFRTVQRTHQQGPTDISSHITTHRWLFLTNVTLASTNNALPDYGVTAPKHVGAVLMSMLM